MPRLEIHHKGTALNVKKFPGRVHFINCDVLNHREIEQAVHETVEQFGQIDCLINNVGWYPPKKVIDEISAEECIFLFRLNFLSGFMFSKFSLPYLRKTKGNIINMSSATTYFGDAGAVTYVSTKGAINAFTKGLGKADMLFFFPPAGAEAVAFCLSGQGLATEMGGSAFQEATNIFSSSWLSAWADAQKPSRDRPCGVSDIRLASARSVGGFRENPKIRSPWSRRERLAAECGAREAALPIEPPGARRGGPDSPLRMLRAPHPTPGDSLAREGRGPRHPPPRPRRACRSPRASSGPVCT